MDFTKRVAAVIGFAGRTIKRMGEKKRLGAGASRPAVVEALESREMMSAPDLMITAMTGITGVLVPGQTITGTLTARNIALADAAGPTEAQIVLSGDKIFGNADDILIANVATTGLGAGKMSINPFSAKLGEFVPDGKYYVIARADIHTGVVEFNEENNVFVGGQVTVARSSITVSGPVTKIAETGGKGSFVITRAGAPLTVDLAVHFEMTGTATRGSDYVLKVGDVTFEGDVVTIPAKAGSVTVQVYTIGDTSIEGAETIGLGVLGSMATPPTYTVSETKGSASITITDDEPTVKMTASATKMGEDGFVTFTVARSGGSNKEALTVFFDTFAPDGVVQDKDYKLVGADGKTLSDSIVIGANQAQVTFKAVAIEDSEIEGNETFVVHLAPTLTYSVDPLKHEGKVTIIDNEPTVKLTASSMKMNEDGFVTFTVARSGGSNKAALAVYFDTVGSATLGVDYKFVAMDGKTDIVGGMVTLGANQAQVMFKAVGMDDQVIEGTEGFAVLLEAAPGAPTYSIDPLNNQTHTSIADNEPTVKISVAPNKTSESNGSVTFTVARGGVGTSNKLPLAVAFTPSGSAIQGLDYKLMAADGKTELTNTVTIPANAAQVTFKAVIKDDEFIEGEENFTLTLATAIENPSYVVDTGKFSASVVIADNEPVISLTSTTTKTTETKGFATFTVMRTGGSTKSPLTVFLEEMGSATLDADYSLVSNDGKVPLGNTVTIPAGAAQVMFKALITDDSKIEGTENFTLKVVTGEGEPTYTVNPTKNEATVTIADNEPTVSVVAVKNASETSPTANKGQFKFTRTGGNTGSALTLSFNILNSGVGVALLGTDYTLSATPASAKLTTEGSGPITGTITFAAGVSSVMVDVTAISDSVLGEGTETVGVGILGSEAFALEAGKATATLTISDGKAPPPAPGSPMSVGRFGTSVTLTSHRTVSSFSVPIPGHPNFNQSAYDGKISSDGHTGTFAYAASTDTGVKTDKQFLFSAFILDAKDGFLGDFGEDGLILTFTGSRPPSLEGKTIQFFPSGTAGTLGTFEITPISTDVKVTGSFKLV